ncbi:MAG TPA: hypothetical protein VFO38_04600 [Candidatus Saccharimonadales bacterium]|nr:hypothetical protein [Candidatus Saccharimonadales bacterium]
MRVGLITGTISFLALAVYSYIENHDVLLAILSIGGMLGLIYELAKSIRNTKYHLDKKSKLIISGTIMLLGVWHTSLGSLSPYLISGIFAVALVIVDIKKPKQKV